MNRILIFCAIIVALAGSLISFNTIFSDEIKQDTPRIVKQTSAQAVKIFSDTTINISGVLVDLKFPAEIKADLLILPGWNYERTKWCNESALCKKALEKGHRLILPEMGKSIYASNYFPKTRNDWLKYPTLTWLCDTMIPFLQKEFGVLKSENKNFIVGLSTGARGVILVSNREQIFSAAAALSGDYDQTTMQKDNLFKGVYGEYSKFKERWEKMDNPTQQISLMKTPLYLGHGLADSIVPVEQTINFYKNLQKLRPDLKVQFHAPENQGHNFKYWNSEVEAILNFFEKK